MSWRDGWTTTLRMFPREMQGLTNGIALSFMEHRRHVDSQIVKTTPGANSVPGLNKSNF